MKREETEKISNKEDIVKCLDVENSLVNSNTEKRDF
jgi:hypothetical protein